jgi:thioredoxin-dependent peroxiredoxin
MKSMATSFLCIFLIYFSPTAHGQKLKVGQKAPNFTVLDSHQDTVSLRKFSNQKVLLAFFRYAGCPVCNFRMHELIQNYNYLKAQGYMVIAVFESDNKVLAEYSQDNSIPFFIIGDPKLELYKKYGIQKSFWKTLKSAFHGSLRKEAVRGLGLFKGKKYKRDGNMTRLPADFIIDETGTIRVAYYGRTIDDHLPMKDILNY